MVENGVVWYKMLTNDDKLLIAGRIRSNELNSLTVSKMVNDNRHKLAPSIYAYHQSLIERMVLSPPVITQQDNKRLKKLPKFDSNTCQLIITYSSLMVLISIFFPPIQNTTKQIRWDVM